MKTNRTLRQLADMLVIGMFVVTAFLLGLMMGWLSSVHSGNSQTMTLTPIEKGK